MTVPLSFPQKPKFFWLAVLSPNFGYRTSMPQDFKKNQNCWIFSSYWFFPKSYHFILALIAPFGLEKSFNGS